MRTLWPIIAVLAWCFQPAPAHAQKAWEFSPYAVGVWVAVDDPALVSGWTADQLYRRVDELAAAHVGAAWSLSATAAPPSLTGELVTRLESIDANQILADEKLIAGLDKLMLVALARADDRWRIRVRELDLATRQLSPLLVRDTHSDESLPHELLRSIVSVFAPLAQIKHVDEKRVEARLRAAGLATDETSPVLVAAGAPLVPILRPEDRLGRARTEHVRPISWTVLEVKQRDGAKLQCLLHSAQHKPLAGRASLRVKRYALAVRPSARPSQLTLQTPGDAPRKLVDYELVEEDEKTKAITSLGRTDEQGRVTIAPTATPLRLIYLRHGDQLLARLPMIPGWQEQPIAHVNSDDTRLAAATFVATLKQEIIDTVARRQILAARLLRQVDRGELADARKLLEEFQRLPGPHEFAARVEGAKSQFPGSSPRAQERIDQLLAEAAEALRLYLDPKELDRLESQLAAARQE
jgi:hypothetical protein